MKLKKMINRILSGILVTGMLSCMIMTVYADDVGNTLPFVPFEPPETPTEPEVPDNPTVPDESEMPDTPNVPDTPAEPEIPDTPSNPGTSDTPDWSDILEWLDKVDTQEKQENTDQKDTPKEETKIESQDPEQMDYSLCRRDSTCPMYTFIDLDRNAWYHDDIHYCIENGLMNGMSSDTFAPASSLTRAMLVTVLWRLEDKPVVNYLMQFDDVSENEWYTEAVNWASVNGIVNGYGDNTFGPMNDVTREQVMAILHRYAVYKSLDSGVIFPMIPQYDYSLWAENDIIWADMVGLTSNLGVDIFDMTASANRAEIAAYLRRFCETFMGK